MISTPSVSITRQLHRILNLGALSCMDLHRWSCVTKISRNSLQSEFNWVVKLPMYQPLCTQLFVNVPKPQTMWVPLMWSMCGGGLLWALQPLAGGYWPEGCVSNEQRGRGSFLWVCLLWFVGASDVVSVWACVTVGFAAPCRCLLARRVSLRGVCV